MKRDDAISKIQAIAEEAAKPAGIEIVEVELKGSGRHYLLRVYIDKPQGITHADCESISQRISAALDTDDPIPGSYDLEVSSPGVERKLLRWRDWERFAGRKVKVTLKAPSTLAMVTSGGDIPVQSELKHFNGVISRAEDHKVTVQLTGGGEITFPFEQVQHANLKFDW